MNVGGGKVLEQHGEPCRVYLTKLFPGESDIFSKEKQGMCIF